MSICLHLAILYHYICKTESIHHDWLSVLGISSILVVSPTPEIMIYDLDRCLESCADTTVSLEGLPKSSSSHTSQLPQYSLVHVALLFLECPRNWIVWCFSDCSIRLCSCRTPRLRCTREQTCPSCFTHHLLEAIMVVASFLPMWVKRLYTFVWM